MKKMILGMVLLAINSSAFADGGCPDLADSFLQPGISISGVALEGQGRLFATCHPTSTTTYPSTLCVYRGNAGGTDFFGWHSLAAPPTDGVLMIYANGFMPTNMTLTTTSQAITGQKFYAGGDFGSSIHGKDVVQYNLTNDQLAMRSYSKTGFVSWSEDTQLAKDYSCSHKD